MPDATAAAPRELSDREKRIQSLRKKGASKRTDQESQELRTLVDQEKADRFARVVPGRVQRSLDALDKLIHCGNTTTYIYTPEQVEKIANALNNKMVEVDAAFKPRAAGEDDRDTFSL